MYAPCDKAKYFDYGNVVISCQENRNIMTAFIPMPFIYCFRTAWTILIRRNIIMKAHPMKKFITKYIFFISWVLFTPEYVLDVYAL